MNTNKKNNYIVLDLEWNQAMSSKSSVFNKLPIRLRGEIIQIGAVKLDENLRPAEEFQVDIRPIYFKRMHFKVKKLTGFDAERLSKGLSFADAFSAFKQWCGEDAVFLTWGYDDRGIMEQNIIIHDLDWEWVSAWVNLQIIYNVQTNGDKNQKSLATAMEHFEIEQTRIAHDALGDAYNTALVCSHMDLESGLTQHEDFLKERDTKRKEVKYRPTTEQDPLIRDIVGRFDSKGSAFTHVSVTHMSCPHCERILDKRPWINQGDQRYMSLCTCSEHGKFLIRLKFRADEDEMYNMSRLVYRADEELAQHYERKATEPRKRRRVRNRRKSVKP